MSDKIKLTKEEMAMEINTFNTTEGIIDLHIHSDYSYSQDEYMKTGVKPLELLKEIKEFSDKFGGQSVFSLTDHDNSLGAKEIVEKISSNPEAYKKVKFISGIEFSVCCESIGTYSKTENDKIFKEEKSIVNDIHLLGYNYDVNDPTINYYSKLNSLNFTDTFNYNGCRYPYGKIVLAGMNYLNRLGYPIALKEFLDFKIERGFIEKQAFLKNVNNFCLYCYKKLNLDKEKIKKMRFFLLGINPKKLFKEKKTSEVSAEDVDFKNVINAKLDIMEAMSIIEKAGGVTVLAHPNNIELSPEYVNLFKKSDEKGFITEKSKKRFISKTFQDYVKKETDAKKKLLDFILKKLVLEAYDPATGEKLQGLIGIEVLHRANMFIDYFSILTELGEKYNLYSTGGSDRHGSLKKNVFSIGQIMPNFIEKKFPKSDMRKPMFSIYGCTFIDDILEGNALERKSGNEYIEILAKKKDKLAIFDYFNVKRFISTYAKIDYYEKLKTCDFYKRGSSKFKKFQPEIKFQPIIEK